MRQRWLCGACGAHGVVEHESNAGICHVVYLIDDDHASVSPGCYYDVRKLRVVNGDAEGAWDMERGSDEDIKGPEEVPYSAAE